MIAAFYRALAKAEAWDGRAALRIQTTVDLRRWYIPSGKAEGICNLSTYEHINLGREREGLCRDTVPGQLDYKTQEVRLDRAERAVHGASCRAGPLQPAGESLR